MSTGGVGRCMYEESGCAVRREFCSPKARASESEAKNKRLGGVGRWGQMKEVSRSCGDRRKKKQVSQNGEEKNKMGSAAQQEKASNTSE